MMHRGDLLHSDVGSGLEEGAQASNAVGDVGQSRQDGVGFSDQRSVPRIGPERP